MENIITLKAFDYWELKELFYCNVKQKIPFLNAQEEITLL